MHTMPLEDLGAYLDAHGIATLGVDLFLGTIPLETSGGAIPDGLLALQEMGGAPSLAVHDGAKQVIEQPAVRVLARGAPHDYLDARTRAQAAFLALRRVTNTTLDFTPYLWITAVQSPALLRWDEVHRPIVAFAVRCARGRETIREVPALEEVGHG